VTTRAKEIVVDGLQFDHLSMQGELVYTPAPP